MRFLYYIVNVVHFILDSKKNKPQLKIKLRFIFIFDLIFRILPGTLLLLRMLKY